MAIRQQIKRWLPDWALIPYRAVWRQIHARNALNAVPVQGRELYVKSALTNYGHVVLPAEDEALRQRVITAAKQIFGDAWNFYSDALRPEVAIGFVRTIDSFGDRRDRFDYLEIGSCQGLSMSFIGLLLHSRGLHGRLVSVDPYFSQGYEEGASGPYGQTNNVRVDKDTRDGAQRLYAALGLQVELIENTSEVGLALLLRGNAAFDLIYIDGYHEKLVPMVDFGLSKALCRPSGVIILDDHLWPDVLPLKQLCDRHAKSVQETWKTASYRFD